MLFRLLALTICCARLILSQPASDDEEIWKAYIVWLEAQPANQPSELIDSYRRKLERDGISHSETGRRMRVIGERIFTRSKGIEVFWNKIFAAGEPIYLQTPTALLVTAVRERKPGKALDIGMGQGRNSVFLAVQGWDVTGFDPSEVAVRMARSNAEKAGVKINAIIARDDAFDYGTTQWNLIVMTYVRDLNAADARVFERALKPGGIVVYENGADENNGPLKAFVDRFRILRFEDIETSADWNPQRKTRIQRLVAERRPGDHP